MARRFKLRNGMIVEECSTEDVIVFDNGFIDKYTIIDRNGIDITDEEKAYNFRILIEGKKFPEGGAWGPGYDIIEEIK